MKFKKKTQKKTENCFLKIIFLHTYLYITLLDKLLSKDVMS